jgi:hypothetical protein
MGTPSKVRSRPAGHTKRRTFFCQASRLFCFVPINIVLCKHSRYLPARNRKNLILLGKKCPNACVCAIFVVPLHQISAVMKKVLNIREPNVYARHLEAEVIHPLISVVHFDELEKGVRTSMNSYGVYGLFI